MRRFFFVFILSTLVSSVCGKDLVTDNYRRNSLCLGYIVEGLTTQSEASLVINALQNYQISDKFNNHNIGLIIIDPTQIKMTSEDKAVKIKRHTERLKFSDFAPGKDYKTESKEYEERFYEMPKKLIKFISSNHLANYLVAKWFNPTEELSDGSHFNMDLIQERGAYNASELEKLRANESVRGMSILKDAGMDLIPNTYLAIVRLNFSTAEQHYNRTAERWENSGVTVTNSRGESSNPLGIVGAFKRKSGEEQAGYYVDATIYLFKLVWDEELENEFIENYWNIPDVNSFLSTAKYKLEFIDSQTSQSRIKAKTGISTKDENGLRLISAATYRAIDNGLARLQKKYANFAVMAPVIDIEDKYISSFVGMKEGISKGDEYEVYEKVYNENTNTYRYKKVGSVEVDKSRIWDNRYDIDGNYVGRQDQNGKIVMRKDSGKEIVIDTDNEKTQPNPDVDRTYFKGNTKAIAPGMLIKQKGK